WFPPRAEMPSHWLPVRIRAGRRTRGPLYLFGETREIAHSLCLTCLRNKSRMLAEFREATRAIHSPVGPDSLPKPKKNEMKLTKISNLLMLGLVLTFTALGCKKKPTPL